MGLNGAAYAQGLPGTLDTTFGNNGEVNLGSNQSRNIAVQSDGKILVTGDDSNAYYSSNLERLNADGSLDTSFGQNGVVNAGYFVEPTNPNLYLPTLQDGSIIVQSSGDILLVGDGNVYANGNYKNILVMQRYLPNGQIDTTFGNGGTSHISLGLYQLLESDAIAYSNDQIIVVGTDSVSSSS